MSPEPAPAPLPQPSPAELGTVRSRDDLMVLAAAVAGVAAVDVQQLSAAERKERLIGLRRAIDSLEVCFDTTVAASDTAGDGQVLDGATSTTAWLRHSLHLTGRDAATRVRTARTLGPTLSLAEHATSPVCRAVAAVLDGSISYLHLQAITSTLADLGDHPNLPPDAPTEAVSLMVDLAATVDPGQLRAAARHLRYVLDPDRGRADHDRQAQVRRATLAPLLDGTWRLEMLTTGEGGALLTALLNATGAPTSSDDTRTPAQRRHDSLLDALHAAAQSDQLPIANGLSPHILITAPPEAFLSREAETGQWRPARFADGSPIPAPLFDQLSCSSTLTRIIQEPGGKVLDVGRSHRFFTPAQRTALWVRDQGCRFPGCTAPWTHAHHIIGWQDGGTTDLANGVLLCGHHHRAIHDGTWAITAGAGGADATLVFTHRNGLTSHHSPIPPPDPLRRE